MPTTFTRDPKEIEKACDEMIAYLDRQTEQRVLDVKFNVWDTASPRLSYLGSAVLDLRKPRRFKALRRWARALMRFPRIVSHARYTQLVTQLPGEMRRRARVLEDYRLLQRRYLKERGLHRSKVAECDELKALLAPKKLEAWLDKKKGVVRYTAAQARKAGIVLPVGATGAVVTRS